MLAAEATRQRKLRKKLSRKVEDGELNEAEVAERLARHGRDEATRRERRERARCGG